MHVYLKHHFLSYNNFMRWNKTFFWCLLLVLLTGLLIPARGAQASLAGAEAAQSDEVTAYDLIIAMNTLRVSYGLPALIEDPIINAVAQSTADIMAANQMSWHIGDVRGRLAAAGYGGGATVWATENFAVGHMSIDEIMVVWADAEHMRPAVNPAYCHVGAGVAKAADGRTYYVLQAAYTSSNSCGPYTLPEGPPAGQPPSVNPISQLIIPVKIATPDTNGEIYHVVEAGQSFWAIAVAYQITIHDIEIWNNLSRETPLQTGQRLFIPGSNTEGYATPTPVGMIIPSTPGADGKIVHIVQPYQALITIADAYDITVDTILALNGIQEDWPLQIDQELVISPGWVTPSPTPRPLTPIEKITPDSDGNYYHTVQSGETLSWIASLYNITLANLMTWNGLQADSIIRPEQKLILLVTPPASLTPTPGPSTTTPTVTPTLPPPTPTPTPILSSPSPTVLPISATQPGEISGAWLLVPIFGVAGLVLLIWVRRKRAPSFDPERS